MADEPRADAGVRDLLARMREGRPLVSEVVFVPAEGFPPCLGYVVGADDGKSSLYSTPEAAIEAWAWSMMGELDPDLMMAVQDEFKRTTTRTT